MAPRRVTPILVSQSTNPKTTDQAIKFSIKPTTPYAELPPTTRPIKLLSALAIKAPTTHSIKLRIMLTINEGIMMSEAGITNPRLRRFQLNGPLDMKMTDPAPLVIRGIKVSCPCLCVLIIANDIGSFWV